MYSVHVLISAAAYFLNQTDSYHRNGASWSTTAQEDENITFMYIILTGTIICFALFWRLILDQLTISVLLYITRYSEM